MQIPWQGCCGKSANLPLNQLFGSYAWPRLDPPVGHMAAARVTAC